MLQENVLNRMMECMNILSSVKWNYWLAFRRLEGLKFIHNVIHIVNSDILELRGVIHIIHKYLLSYTHKGVHILSCNNGD